jgi:sigma-B regulation protein RsbU (phosphoserine phosphatase)
VPEDVALASWPDSLEQEGVLTLAGRPYLGAYARRRGEEGDSVSPATRAIAIMPIESILDQDFARVIEAEAFLDVTRSVDSRGAVLSIVPDTLRLSGTQRQGNASMGAALVELMEWQNGAWSPRNTLVWTKVGFFEAIRGLTRNLQENQFNLIPLLFLAVVAFLFVLVELLTLGMVISMGQSITRALVALHQGTTRVREGNLRYRIPIEGEDDLWEVADSFNRMSGTLEQARDLEIEKERLEGELAIAHQIQARLLPSEAPATPRTELAGLSIPAREVGGDYYDFIPLDGERIGLIVADVSGKGVPAALLMSSFRASILSQDLSDGPAEILGRLNNFLYRSVEPGRFVTAFFAIFETQTGRLVYSNAGHNPPYLIGTDSSVRLLREGGLVLGLFGESRYEQAVVQFQEGDTLSLLTDGVTEAQSPEDELWGEDRFLELLQANIKAPCRRIVAETLKAIREFAGGEPQSDDVTLMVARWKGKSADKTPMSETRDAAEEVQPREIVG